MDGHRPGPQPLQRHQLRHLLRRQRRRGAQQQQHPLPVPGLHGPPVDRDRVRDRLLRARTFLSLRQRRLQPYQPDPGTGLRNRRRNGQGRAHLLPQRRPEQPGGPLLRPRDELDPERDHQQFRRTLVSPYIRRQHLRGRAGQAPAAGRGVLSRAGSPRLRPCGKARTHDLGSHGTWHPLLRRPLPDPHPYTTGFSGTYGRITDSLPAPLQGEQPARRACRQRPVQLQHCFRDHPAGCLRAAPDSVGLHVLR